MPNTILAVDNDPDIIDALTAVLESSGYRVVGARNESEALAKLQIEKPDVVILDLATPGDESVVFRKEIARPEWREFRDVPILVLSPPREETTRRHYEMDTGCPIKAEDYIEKPFIPDVLLRQIEKVISPKSV